MEEITTDNGVQFTLTRFADFLQAHGIRHTRSALYSPEANAEVERFNRVIKDGLKGAIAAGQPFRTDLRQLLAAYRWTPPLELARHLFCWLFPCGRLCRCCQQD